MTPIHSNWPAMRVVLAGGALALLVVACGGRGESGPTPTPRVAPTALSAQFAMPTSMITSRAAVTDTVAATTPETSAARTEGAPTATPTPVVDLSRGERVYINQNCGQCHGEQAVGVPDKGSALAGTSLSDAEFDDALRTAYKGELGTDHIFGPNRISPGGVDALHTWLQSLPAN